MLKLADTKNFYARHALGRHEENISNSVKASHPFSQIGSMSDQQAGQVLPKSNTSTNAIR